MRGSLQVRFSDLFADTVRTHGPVFAFCYYCKRGMPEWEFAFWMRALDFWHSDAYSCDYMLAMAT